MTVFDLMNPFDPWITHRQPSVYVISDSELKAWKQKQAEREIAELEKLIEGHQSSVERLQAHVESLRTEYLLPSDNTSEAA